jgi:hypothetical protein
LTPIYTSLLSRSSNASNILSFNFMWGYLDEFLGDPLRLEFQNADEICTLKYLEYT